MAAKETAPKETAPKTDTDKTHKTDEVADVQAPPVDGDDLPIPTDIQK